MEENRLKPMPKGYDPQVFNSIYSNTEKLRKKLASQIDPCRFGVDSQEILSWFDVKFIHCFNRYYDKHNPEILKGHIIKGLQLFKCRVLRAAYTQKSLQNLYTTEINEYDEFEHLTTEETEEWESRREFLTDLVFSYFRKNLTPNAFELLQVQLYPPPFIMNRLEEEGIDNLNKIPNSIFVEYFELGDENRSIKYLNTLKKEIRNCTEAARNYFVTNYPYLVPQLQAI